MPVSEWIEAPQQAVEVSCAPFVSTNRPQQCPPSIHTLQHQLRRKQML